MSTKNVTLHDENGNVLLPATKTSRVTDANGINLDTLLQQAGQVKGVSVNGAQQTIDANGNIELGDVSFFGDTVGNVTTVDFNAQTDTVWNKTQVLGSTQQATARSNINAQETLVSGTNIKTINNISLLGSGNISISGGSGGGGGSISVNDFYYAAWTATSSAAMDARLTNTLVLPEGVYIFRGQYPVCSKVLVSTLDMVNVNNSSTTVSGGSNYGYFTGQNYNQMIDILFVGTGGGEVFLKSAQSTAVTYTYLERGYLAAIKIG